MTKPIPDKAEIALEYPDKLYIGTFEHSSRFEAHLDPTGIALIFERPGADDVHKTVHMHIHFGLFADILRELASTVSRIFRRTTSCIANSLRKRPLRYMRHSQEPEALSNTASQARPYFLARALNSG